VSGVGFGLLDVVPTIMVSQGIHAEGFRDSWITLPAFVASFFTLLGVFGSEGKYVYVFMALGLIANGLFWGAIGHAVQRRIDAPPRTSRGEGP